MSGPLVRSSYRAGRLWAQAKLRRGEPLPPEFAHLAEAPAGPPGGGELTAGAGPVP